MVVGALHGNFRINGQPTQYFDRPITDEDIDMPRDKLADLVGDGQARVTCSFDLGDKDFGNGFGAHCSVTLTCHQSEDDIDRAADLASVLACRHTDEAFDMAAALFKATNKRKRREE